MKKFLYLLVSFLVCPLCSHAVDYVTLNAGDAAVFGENATALLSFDYSEVAINGWTFEEYIDNEGGGEYKERWNKWIKAAEKQFVDEYNKKSTGLKVVRSKKIAVDYKMVLHVQAIPFIQVLPPMAFPVILLSGAFGIKFPQPRLNSVFCGVVSNACASFAQGAAAIGIGVCSVSFGGHYRWNRRNVCSLWAKRQKTYSASSFPRCLARC